MEFKLLSQFFQKNTYETVISGTTLVSATGVIRMGCVGKNDPFGQRKKGVWAEQKRDHILQIIHLFNKTE